MKKSLIKKDRNKKISGKKGGDGIKEKSSKLTTKESTEPRLPVSDANSGYIPFGG